MTRHGSAGFLAFVLLAAGLLGFSGARAFGAPPDFKGERQAFQELLLAGDASAAIDLAVKTLAQAETASPSEPLVQAGLLLDLGQAWTQGEQFERALEALRRAARIRTELLGPTHPDSIRCATAIAKVYVRQGRTKDAELLYDGAWKALSPKSGSGTLDAGLVLFDWAELLRLKNDFSAAEKKYLLGLQTLEDCLGKGDPNLLEFLLTCANFLHDQGKFPTAQPLFARSLEICERRYGPDHLQTAFCLEQLANIAQIRGRLDEGEQLLQRARRIYLAAKGPASSEVILNQAALALLRRDRGELAEARAELQEALALAVASGPRIPVLPAVLHNHLGQIHLDLHESGLAEQAFRNALAIFERELGKDHFLAAQIRANLGLLYQRLDRLEEAEVLLRAGLEATEQEVGKNHWSLAGPLAALARLAQDRLEFDQAEALAKRALQLLVDQFGPDHPAVGLAHNNLGQLYQSQWRNPEAEPHFRKALAITGKGLGPNHPEVLRIETNLGRLYLDEGRLEEARTTLEAVRGKQEQVCPDAFRERVEPSFELGRCLRELGDLPAALRHLDEAVHMLEKHTEAEGLEEYLETNRAGQQRLAHEMLATLADLQTKDPVAAEAWQEKAFAATEISRARQFLSQLSLANAQHPDSLPPTDRRRLLALAKQWQMSSELREKELRKAPPDPAVLAELEDRLGGLRKARTDLMQEFQTKHPRFARLVNVRPISLQDLQQKVLGPDDRLLAFWLGAEHLFGFLVTRTSLRLSAQPAEPQKLRKKIATFRELLSQEVPEEAFKQVGLELYREILAPVLASAPLTASGTLYIVPHDVLSSIPFEALVASEAGNSYQDLDYFFRHARIAYVPSATILGFLQHPGEAQPPEGSGPAKDLLLGDPLYTVGSEPVGQGAGSNPGFLESARAILRSGSEAKPRLRRVFREAGDGALSLAPLPGTRAEVEAIGAIRRKVGSQADLLLGADASEGRLKRLHAEKLLPGYGFIHFACHGILPDEVRGLVEPCLALSLVGDHGEDGLLKMGEILGLEMHARLVTLSACQTGVETGETLAQGVSGLARAFFFAGTPRVAVTLWSVSDQATAGFMTRFYESLSQGSGFHESLHSARQHLLASPEFSSPCYWAPFILIGKP